MATKRILKVFLWVLSAPPLGVSLLLEVLPAKKLRSDLNRCVALTNRYGESVPQAFIDAVILAEDHRSDLHPGIDVIAMARALWIRVRFGQVQGASTIEQQYVRVVTNCHERTIYRKAREQLLALMVARRTQKRRVSSAYLAIAFYGSGSVGLDGLRARFGEDLSRVPFPQALQMVAQLKYPRPRQPNEAWKSKMAARVDALHSFGAGERGQFSHCSIPVTVVLNRVRAGIVRQPENWPWSSYRAMTRLGRVIRGRML